MLLLESIIVASLAWEEGYKVTILKYYVRAGHGRQGSTTALVVAIDILSTATDI